MKYIVSSKVIWYLVFFAAASSGCGSAEAIKMYGYPTTKSNLENALTEVIKINPNIVLDTVKREVIVRRNPDDLNDTTTVTINLSDFHGKDSASIAESYDGETKIKIRVGQIENEYTFRYLGTRQHWNTAASSAIFISVVPDKYGHTLMQGQNEYGEFRSTMAKEFTDLFEKEVISKTDEKLNLKHTVE
jgi:hypothetical protein